MDNYPAQPLSHDERREIVAKMCEALAKLAAAIGAEFVTAVALVPAGGDGRYVHILDAYAGRIPDGGFADLYATLAKAHKDIEAGKSGSLQ